jgi:prepilin-type N-terminal cleavage/methylation domain-containing protein
MSPTDSLSSRQVPPVRSRALHRPGEAGFTLVEVMIATTISSFVLLGVITTFLMIGRNGYNAANYSIMESEARRALEQFSEEARMANAIVWTDSNTITLTVAGSSTYTVTYAYDSSTSGATAQCFYRMLGAVGSGNSKLILVHNVTDFSFRRYKVINAVDYTASNDLETKQIQITLRAVRTGVTTVATTNAVLSARVVLRNKLVTT